MEPKSKLPALIPTFSLTEEKSNIVAYSIRGNNKTIFCEGVTVINGWVNLVNLRIKNNFFSAIELIKPAHRYCGNLESKAHLGNPQGGEMRVEGYTTISSKSMHQQFVDTIDSYNKDEMVEIDLWARTSKEEALKISDEKRMKYNTETLVSNNLKFSYFVETLIRDFLWKEFLKIPKWQRWLFRKNRSDWISEKRKSPEIHDMEKEFITRVETEYEEAKIEYEGKLTYDKEIGIKIFNWYGNNLRNDNVSMKDHQLCK